MMANDGEKWRGRLGKPICYEPNLLVEKSFRTLINLYAFRHRCPVNCLPGGGYQQERLRARLNRNFETRAGGTPTNGRHEAYHYDRG